MDRSTKYTYNNNNNMPLSRRLDRMIQNESSDPNGSNVCLVSAVRVRHNANYDP